MSPLPSGVQHKLWVNVRDPSVLLPLTTCNLPLAVRPLLEALQSWAETRTLSGRQPKEQATKAKGSFMNETKAQTKKKTMWCADRDGEGSERDNSNRVGTRALRVPSWAPYGHARPLASFSVIVMRVFVCLPLCVCVWVHFSVAAGKVHNMLCTYIFAPHTAPPLQHLCPRTWPEIAPYPEAREIERSQRSLRRCCCYFAYALKFFTANGSRYRYKLLSICNLWSRSSCASSEADQKGDRVRERKGEKKRIQAGTNEI